MVRVRRGELGGDTFTAAAPIRSKSTEGSATKPVAEALPHHPQDWWQPPSLLFSLGFDTAGARDSCPELTGRRRGQGTPIPAAGALLVGTPQLAFPKLCCTSRRI